MHVIDCKTWAEPFRVCLGWKELLLIRNCSLSNWNKSIFSIRKTTKKASHEENQQTAEATNAKKINNMEGWRDRQTKHDKDKSQCSDYEVLNMHGLRTSSLEPHGCRSIYDEMFRHASCCYYGHKSSVSSTLQNINCWLLWAERVNLIQLLQFSINHINNLTTRSFLHLPSHKNEL